jgi:hypothetical protein
MRWNLRVAKPQKTHYTQPWTGQRALLQAMAQNKPAEQLLPPYPFEIRLASYAFAPSNNADHHKSGNWVNTNPLLVFEDSTENSWRPSH